MIVEGAGAADAEAVAAIYAHHVLEGVGTFEERPPNAAEIERRRAGVAALGLPFLVARARGAVVGFAYASAFRARAGYRYTVEDSVYVAPHCLGRGLGKALLGAVIERCASVGLRQMIAVVGDSGNAASIGLHGAAGFVETGRLANAGFKFGRWVDVVLMQRPLGEAASTAPKVPGLWL